MSMETIIIERNWMVVSLHTMSEMFGNTRLSTDVCVCVCVSVSV